MNTAVPVERDAKAKLTTARLLLAQFNAQLAEWKHMAPARRKRTARGRDLASRLEGLKAGREKWAARVADLEARITVDG